MKAAMHMASDCARIFMTIPEFQSKVINIFCRGSSGSILASLFASQITNESVICYVRKNNEPSHDGSGGSHRLTNHAINIIIDDFACSGSTIRSIYEHMLESTVETVDILILQNGSGLIENGNFPFQPKYFIHI